MSSLEDDDGLPTVRLSAPDLQLRLLRRLQAFALKHPVATKAIFAGLAAEGEAFAATPEGALWRDKLAGSELLHRARLLADLPGLALLERRSDAAYPSAYLDAIFTFASSRRPEAMIEPLLDREFGLDDV